MMYTFDYASPSVFQSQRETTLVGLSANARRPVQFCGKVASEHAFLLRVALRALGEAVWSSDTWLESADILDPVITVHPDRLFFEAFSQDQSSYVSLIVDRQVFETQGDVVTGTTNIDFTAWLWGALGEMRSSRETTFQIAADGFEVATSSAGGRWERKVDLPDAWVRGFLQVQAAMAMPGTRLEVKPVDLLSAIRFLRYTKAKVSPRALRYEFQPGVDAQLVLEPWEKVIPLEDAAHGYEQPKTTRVWGRRRLKLIEGLLPFADRVEVYLKGRALPSFYAVSLPGMTFVLGLTGWSGSPFSSSGGFDLLAEAAASDDRWLLPILEMLREQYHASTELVAARLGLDMATASRALVRLCRRGECMFDVQRREYRHRQLFEQVIDESKYFLPDERQEQATRICSEQLVAVESCTMEETVRQVKLKSLDGKQRREIIYRDWRVIGSVSKGSTPVVNLDHAGAVEIVVNEAARIIFGKCGGSFFQENHLNMGPCAHMLALFRASEALRSDGPSSRQAVDFDSGPKQPSRWEVDGGSGNADDHEVDDDLEDDA